MTATTIDALTLEHALALLPKRIAAKIATADGNDCWVWTAGCTHQGYPRLRWDGRDDTAHRVVYLLLVAPIGPGLTLDHLCRNPPCVNPAHLEPVTLRENIARGRGVGVINAAKTHCIHGHEFTPENVYFKRGKRSCRECGRQATRRWRERTAA